MSEFVIKKGRDIKLKGAAEKKIADVPLPQQVAIQPPDLRGFCLSPGVKMGDLVKVGTPILEHREHTEIKIVSPGSGKVIAINYDDKRSILNVIVQLDGKQEAITHRSFSSAEIKDLSRAEIIPELLEGGVWACLRQRPFSKTASPQDTPKSIFVQAMNTEPLALDVDVILQNRERDFQIGLDILRKLTKGKVHLCYSPTATSKALALAENVEGHQFFGPHPAGNVGTHIHLIDPIVKGQVVWHIRAEDVLRVAMLFLKGKYSPERYVAITGEGAPKRIYKKTIVGTPVVSLLEKISLEGMCCLSGSVLSGTRVEPVNGFLGYHDSQITVIPEGGKRELLGWLSMSSNKFSFSRAFVSSWIGRNREVSLDTDEHGSGRAIVINDIYDRWQALDVMTFFLIRAILAGDVEKAQQLGILECAEEDFALCTFACPSKVEVGRILRQGLDLVEEKGQG